MPVITCIEDLHQLFIKRVPRMFVDYVDSGSWTESTYRDNCTAFEKIKLRQRVMVDMANRSVATSMLGEQVAMPVALAPIGSGGMQHADGEILAAKAAEAFSVPYILSTLSVCSIEDVASHTQKPFWFQLYMMRDRAFVERLIDRAKAANCSALVLTADLQIIGQRHRDIKNGLTTPPKPTIRNLLNIASKPRWALAMLATKRRTFGNVMGHVKNIDNMNNLSMWTNTQFDQSLSWDDVKWLKDKWGGKLVIKGIMDPEDAVLAVNSGADAVVVSNHGGRQLDGAPASIDALPAIVDAVGGTTEVWMDGGIRTGQDIIKAVALGAKGTFIGRAYIYGLGAMGEAGVTKSLTVLRDELDTTMAFCGLRDIQDVDSNIIWRA